MINAKKKKKRENKELEMQQFAEKEKVEASKRQEKLLSRAEKLKKTLD